MILHALITEYSVDGPQYAWPSSDTLDGKQSKWHLGYHIKVTYTTLVEVQAPPMVFESIWLPI